MSFPIILLYKRYTKQAYYSYFRAFSLSQHQGLFQWVGSSYQVAKVLEPQRQYQSFPMNIQGWNNLKKLRSWHLVPSVPCCAVLCHFSFVWLFATLWTVAHKAPLSMGFSRQEYWSGFPHHFMANRRGKKWK